MKPKKHGLCARLPAKGCAGCRLTLATGVAAGARGLSSPRTWCGGRRCPVDATCLSSPIARPIGDITATPGAQVRAGTFLDTSCRPIRTDASLPYKFGAASGGGAATRYASDGHRPGGVDQAFLAGQSGRACRRIQGAEPRCSGKGGERAHRNLSGHPLPRLERTTGFASPCKTGHGLR